MAAVQNGADSGLLHATNVSFQIATSRLLNDVSLTLSAGEVVGLIGPNGAGKSTLLKVLSGMRKATSGKITLKGQRLDHYDARQIARLIGQVQQSATLDSPFSVQEVVAMGRNPHLGRFQVEKAHDHAVIAESMQLTSIAELAQRSIGTLSSGERQRVFLARALAQEPSILLLDEPTSNLDIRHQIDILSLVHHLAQDRGLGVLIAIHDLSLAARFCDRLILLYEGAMVAEGTPECVLTRENLAHAFAVHAHPYYDPYTNDLKLSISLDDIESVINEKTESAHAAR